LSGALNWRLSFTFRRACFSAADRSGAAQIRRLYFLRAPFGDPPHGAADPRSVVVFINTQVKILSQVVFSSGFRANTR
jgi:hypothetical protein